MGKVYTRPDDESDVMATLADVRAEYHEGLDDASVSVEVLFVFDEDFPNLPCLTHQGYGAAATVKILGVKERAAGSGDARIVIDRATWDELDDDGRRALLDHELHHLVPTKKTDTAGRPKLRMRLHDLVVGGFKDIIDRHGDRALDARQIRAMHEVLRQLPLPFDVKATEEPEEDDDTRSATLTVAGRSKAPVEIQGEDMDQVGRMLRKAVAKAMVR